MAHRRHITITAAFIMMLGTSTGIAAAGEPAREEISTPFATAPGHDRMKSQKPMPRISPRLSDSIATRIRSSFELAVDRLEEHAECRDLFSEIGSDGIEALSTTLYYPAALKLERDLCRRAEGYTVVGGAPTWLCRRFSKLSDQRAAMVLIHEALHHAGLNEQPSDPSAPSSREINDMVSEACRL
jgi:hypothetical protein